MRFSAAIFLALLGSASCGLLRSTSPSSPLDGNLDDDPIASYDARVTAPLGWIPLRRTRLRPGEREIRVIEPSWSMYGAPTTFLRLRERGSKVAGEVALGWNLRMASVATRQSPYYQPEALRSRGCLEPIRRGTQIGCRLRAEQESLRGAVEELSTMDAWRDPDHPAVAVYDSMTGRSVLRLGYRAACADVPVLHVEVLDGQKYSSYSVTECGSQPSRTRLHELFRLLRGLDGREATEISTDWPVPRCGLRGPAPPDGLCHRSELAGF
jgi:hypothetical protein